LGDNQIHPEIMNAELRFDRCTLIFQESLSAGAYELKKKKRKYDSAPPLRHDDLRSEVHAYLDGFLSKACLQAAEQK